MDALIRNCASNLRFFSESILELVLELLNTNDIQYVQMATETVFFLLLINFTNFFFKKITSLKHFQPTIKNNQIQLHHYFPDIGDVLIISLQFQLVLNSKIYYHDLKKKKTN